MRHITTAELSEASHRAKDAKERWQNARDNYLRLPTWDKEVSLVNAHREHRGAQYDFGVATQNIKQSVIAIHDRAAAQQGHDMLCDDANDPARWASD